MRNKTRRLQFIRSFCTTKNIVEFWSLWTTTGKSSSTESQGIINWSHEFQSKNVEKKMLATDEKMKTNETSKHLRRQKKNQRQKNERRQTHRKSNGTDANQTFDELDWMKEESNSQKKGWRKTNDKAKKMKALFVLILIVAACAEIFVCLSVLSFLHR